VIAWARHISVRPFRAPGPPAATLSFEPWITQTGDVNERTATAVAWICAGFAALFVAAAIIETAIGTTQFGWWRSPGIDLQIYLDASRRLLSGGAWFLDRQLGGPYELQMGDILYAPVAVWLFAPFLVLPAILWWAIPVAIVTTSIRHWRPAPQAWPFMAACLIWPFTPARFITGNPVIWVAAFAAAGLRFGWPGAMVWLKPSLFPFAAIGIRHRGWWIVVAALAIGSLPFLAVTRQWVTVVLDGRGGGLLYSAVDVPTVLIPVLAWLGRRTRGQSDDRRIDGLLRPTAREPGASSPAA
jgi:hypothetical protein